MAAAIDDGISLFKRALGCFTQKPRLANTRLTAYQEHRGRFTTQVAIDCGKFSDPPDEATRGDSSRAMGSAQPRRSRQRSKCGSEGGDRWPPWRIRRWDVQHDIASRESCQGLQGCAIPRGKPQGFHK